MSAGKTLAGRDVNADVTGRCYVGCRLVYQEINLGEAIANATYASGWTNIVYYDGEILSINGGRPALAALSERTVSMCICNVGNVWHSLQN